MYFFFIFLFLLFLVFFVINHCRKKKIIRKICALSCEEKCLAVNELVKPFGYCYDASQDIFSSTVEAWQKDFGYTALYDRAAAHFNMVFDREPVYFNYANRTWLIEFWKGEYGITAGGEIGIYYADSILQKRELSGTVFHGVSESEMLPVSFQLFHQEKQIACLARRHWWLTAFRLGWFVRPKDLIMCAAVTFPNRQMMDAFWEALLALGYKTSEIGVCGLKVSFYFASSHTDCFGCIRRFIRSFALWRDKMLCKLFCFVTRPFCCGGDKLLYLYSYLPFAFKRMACIRRYKKCKRR